LTLKLRAPAAADVARKQTLQLPCPSTRACAAKNASCSDRRILGGIFRPCAPWTRVARPARVLSTVSRRRASQQTMGRLTDGGAPLDESVQFVIFSFARPSGLTAGLGILETGRYIEVSICQLRSIVMVSYVTCIGHTILVQ